MATPVGTVAELWRFPVKSMQGERRAAVEVTDRGVVGDRAYALIDGDDGKVVSAKNPRKWGRVLELTASFVDEPDVGRPPPPVAITLPDGTAVRSDEPDVDARLSRLLGRPVHLAATGPPERIMEETWPDVEGLAPRAFIDSTRIATDHPAETVTDVPMAMAAPPGTFFDLATLHLLTTATLTRLSQLQPGGDFDVRRYRPNVLVAADGDGFVENDWVGEVVDLGDEAAMRIDLPTMRCIMTTMAQPGLERDPSLLVTIARNNRLEVFGGQWACAGSYGSVAAPGAICVGDAVRRR